MDYNNSINMSSNMSNLASFGCHDYTNSINMSSSMSNLASFGCHDYTNGINMSSSMPNLASFGCHDYTNNINNTNNINMSSNTPNLASFGFHGYTNSINMSSNMSNLASFGCHDYTHSVNMSSNMPILVSFGCPGRKMHCLMSDSMMDKGHMVTDKLDMPMCFDGPVNNTLPSLIMLPGMVPHEESPIVFPIRRSLRRQINQQTRFDPDVIDSDYNALQNDQSLFKKLKKGIRRFGRYVRRGMRNLCCIQVGNRTYRPDLS